MMKRGHDTSHPQERERGITIRRLDETDAAAIHRLAGRDSKPVPSGQLLGLLVEGHLVAMQPLAEGGAVIADPFARTAELGELLELRVTQLRARARRRAPQVRTRRAPAHGVHALARSRPAG